MGDPAVEDMVVASSSAEEMEHALENIVVASSSAEEIQHPDSDNEAESGKDNRKRRREDEPGSGRKNRKHDERREKMNWTENEVPDSGEKVSGVRGPRMDREEFFERYPCIATNVTHYYPYYGAKTLIDEDVIRDCFTFVSPKKLDVLEGEWINYYNEDCQCSQQRVALILKYWALLQQAQEAYKQPEQANVNNTRSKICCDNKKPLKNKRSKFASKYPLVNAGLDDFMDLPENHAKDIRRDYLMSNAEQQLQELECESVSAYDAQFRLANNLVLLIEKQTNLLHMGTKAYRKYHKLFTKGTYS